MTPERAQRIKRMIASGAMLEGVLMSLNACISQDPEGARKIAAHPEFLAQVIDRLLDRFVPYFEAMDDQAIQDATTFQESAAGKAYAEQLKGLVQAMPSIAEAWMGEVQTMLKELS